MAQLASWRRVEVVRPRLGEVADLPEQRRARRLARPSTIRPWTALRSRGFAYLRLRTAAPQAAFAERCASQPSGESSRRFDAADELGQIPRVLRVARRSRPAAASSRASSRP